MDVQDFAGRTINLRPNRANRLKSGRTCPVRPEAVDPKVAPAPDLLAPHLSSIWSAYSSHVEAAGVGRTPVPQSD